MPELKTLPEHLHLLRNAHTFLLSSAFKIQQYLTLKPDKYSHHLYACDIRKNPLGPLHSLLFTLCSDAACRIPLVLPDALRQHCSRRGREAAVQQRDPARCIRTLLLQCLNASGNYLWKSHPAAAHRAHTSHTSSSRPHKLGAQGRIH